jgi:hypothetical protein
MQALPGPTIEVIETEFFFKLLVRLLETHRPLIVAAPSTSVCMGSAWGLDDCSRSGQNADGEEHRFARRSYAAH